MGIFRDRLSRELSRLEMAMAAIVILVVFYAVFDRLERVMANVERARLDVTVMRLNTSLDAEIASRLIGGDRASLAALEGANPMAFEGLGMGEVLAGAGGSPAEGGRAVPDEDRYLGELAGPDPGRIDGGKWYFDKQAGALVYRVANEAFFSSPLPGPKRARFRVTLEYEDANGNARFDSGIDRFKWARLRPIEEFHWR